MVKTILIVVATMIITMFITVLLLYFFAFRKFFEFMNEERMKFHSEMNVNMNEIMSEVDKTSEHGNLQGLLSDGKVGVLDEK